MAFTPSKPGNENDNAVIQAGNKAIDPAKILKQAAAQPGKVGDAYAASLKALGDKALTKHGQDRLAKRKADDDDAQPANSSDATEDADTQAGYADEPIVLAAADTGTAEAASSAAGSSGAGAAGAEATVGTAAGGEVAAGAAATAATGSVTGAILGTLAIAGVAAAGGGGGGAAAATGFTLSGTIVLGKINDTTGLVVEAFKADGTQLAGGTGTINADGTYSITVTENYSGPVLIRLKDTSAGTNYTDEGTGAAKDLTTDLRAVVNVSGNGTVTVAITPLTELAVRELLGDSGGDAGTATTTLGSVTTSQVTTANDNVETAFGLSGDITTTVPVTVDDATAFNAGTTAQKAYGQVLAAIAGAEVDQGASTGEVLAALSEGLVGSSLSISAVDDLLAGAAVADSVGTNVTGTAAALDTAIGSNIGNVALSADTGADDFITQTAAQTITATLDTALSGTKLWGSVDGGTTWTDITSFVTGMDLTWTGVTLASGDNLIKFAVTADTVTSFTGATKDVVGDISVQSYAVDTTNPTITSGTSADFAENGTGTAYDAAATDAHLLVYTVGGTDAALFNIDAASGVVTLKNAPNFEAPADADANNVFDITVTATDGAGNATTQSVAITVTNVNETPTLTSGTEAHFEENGTTTAYTVTATDPDANTTLAYALAGTDAALFNIDAGTGAVTFKTAPNFEAPADAGGDNVYDITVTASDGSITTSAQAVTIMVMNANETPTITSAATANFAENGTGAAYTVTATDPDAGTTLTYALGGTDAALFDLNTSTGAVTFKAAPNFEAPADAGGDNVYDVTVTASDGSITTSAQAVAITVTNVNESPTSTTVTATTAVTNQAYSFDVSGSFSDPDANTTLSYSATGLPAGLSISSAGVISGTATAEALTNSVTVTATDGSLTTQQIFNLAVVSAPTITAITADVAQANSGDALTLTATLSESVTIATGATAPTLTFDVSGQTMTATYSGGSSTNTNTLTFTATAPATVDDSSVTVSAISLGDATITGNTSQQPFVTSATGQAVSSFVIDNNVPAFTSDTTASFAENATGTVYTAATTDSTAVTYALSGTDAGSFTLTNGALTFNSAPNFEAKSSYSVTITATDALSQAASRNVTVNVTNVNEAPTSSPATSTDTIVVNQALNDTIADLFSDVDVGDTLTFTATGLPTGISLATNGNITGTPTATGTFEITFTATDSGSLTATHTATVNVVSAPTITNTSTLDGVANLDARSDLVLTFSDTISLGSGQIRIMDDMGTSGWTLTNTTTAESKQDTTDNDVIITLTNGAVTGLTIGGVDKSADMAGSVTASGNVLTISPAGSDTASSTDWDFDWDFGANYHIEMDAGVVTANGVGNVAISDSTTLNFTTVTPVGDATGAASQKMAADGTLAAGYTWHHGHVADATETGFAMSFSTGSHGLVLQSETGADNRKATIGGKVLLSGFGTDDVIYMDNMGDMSMLTTDGQKGASYTGSGNTNARLLDNADGGTQLQTVFADYASTTFTAITSLGGGDLMLENSTHFNANLVIFG